MSSRGQNRVWHAMLLTIFSKNKLLIETPGKQIRLRSSLEEGATNAINCLQWD